MKKILFALLIVSLLLFTACAKKVQVGEHGETITTEQKGTKATVTVENEMGTTVINYNHLAKTATMETEFKINDTTESGEGPMGEVDMAPMMFNIFCLGMAQVFNESASEGDDGIRGAIGEYTPTKVTFTMVDEEDGEKIGTCVATSLEDIDCTAHRTYENGLFGMKMCDLEMEGVQEAFGMGQ